MVSPFKEKRIKDFIEAWKDSKPEDLTCRTMVNFISLALDEYMFEIYEAIHKVEEIQGQKWDGNRHNQLTTVGKKDVIDALLSV